MFILENRNQKKSRAKALFLIFFNFTKSKLRYSMLLTNYYYYKVINTPWYGRWSTVSFM